MFQYFVLPFLAISCQAYVNVCPGHWPNTDFVRQFKDHCYMFVRHDKGTWGDALWNCKTQGGYLTDIRRRNENDFIFNSLKELDFAYDEGVWIALTGVLEEETWEWFTPTYTEFRFTNWADGQPMNELGNENCAVMKAGDKGGWSARPCEDEERYGWVCKYPDI